MHIRALIVVAATVVGSTACHHNTRTGMNDPALTDTQWSVVELNGAPAGLGSGSKPATLQFSAEEHRASGFAGCNRASGGYTLNGSTLRFGPLVMTRMACDVGMDLEQKYSAMLATVQKYRITNGELQLISGDGVVARLTPIRETK